MKIELTKEPNHIEVFTSNVLFALVGRLGGKFLFVLIQVILARFLGADLYGIYSIGWVAFTLLGMMAPLGLDNGVIQFASKYWHKNKLFAAYIVRKALLISAISGFLLGALFFSLSTQISIKLDKPQLAIILQMFSIALPLYSVLRVTSAATTLSQQIKYSLYAEDLGQPISNILLLVVLLWGGLSLLGASIAVVLSFCVGLGIALYSAIRLFPFKVSMNSKEQFDTAEMLRFSFPTLLASLFTIFIVSGNRLLLGYFKPSAEAGIFQAVSQISIIFSVILGSLNLIFSPIIADLYHAANLNQLNDLFKISTKWGLYISIPFFLLIIFFPREIIYVVFGREYLTGSFSLIVLSISQLINAGTGAVGLLLIMTGRQKDWLYISFGTFFVNFFLSIFIIPKWGLDGAAISTTLGTAALFIFSLFRVRSILKLWPYDLRYIKGLGATLITAAVLFLTTMIKFQSLFLQIIIAGIAAVLIFGFALYLLKFDPEDKKLIRLLGKYIIH